MFVARTFGGCAALVAMAACPEMGGPPPFTAFEAILSGANEVPPVTSSASGSGVFTVIPRGAIGSDSLVYLITLSTAFPAADSIIEAHIHSPALSNGTAGIAVWLCGSTVGGGATPPVGPAGTPTCPTGLASGQVISGRVPISTAQVNHIRSYAAYANVHTKSNTDGEIRGQLRVAGL